MPKKSPTEIADDVHANMAEWLLPGETILKILKAHGFHDLAYIVAVMAANKQVDVSWTFEQYMFTARVALGRARIKANATDDFISTSNRATLLIGPSGYNKSCITSAAIEVAQVVDKIVAGTAKRDYPSVATQDLPFFFPACTRSCLINSTEGQRHGASQGTGGQRLYRRPHQRRSDGLGVATDPREPVVVTPAFLNCS